MDDALILLLIITALMTFIYMRIRIKLLMLTMYLFFLIIAAISFTFGEWPYFPWANLLILIYVSFITFTLIWRKSDE